MKTRKHMDMTRNTLLGALLAGVGVMVPLQSAQAADVTIGGKEVTVWGSLLGTPVPDGNNGGVLNAPGGITTTTLGTSGNATVGGALSVTGVTTTKGITNTGLLTNNGNAKIDGDLEVTGKVDSAEVNAGKVNAGEVNAGEVNTAKVNATTGNFGTLNVGQDVNVGRNLSVEGMTNTHGINNNGQRIQNVGAAVAGTDAVNLNQLNERFGEAQKYTDNGVAAALAIPSMPTLAPGKGWAGMAVGNYGSATAVGLAVGYQVNERWNLGLGVSQATRSGGKTAVKAQAGFSW